MDAYAGLDVGTSSTKAVVYDAEGNVLYTAQRHYMESGDNGRRELDPIIVKNAVYEVLKEVGNQCPARVKALSVASLGESIVCLDSCGRTLYPSMLTGDSRGIFETEELIRRVGARKIFEITGLPPNELYGLPKYMWLNRNTDVIQKSTAILFYEDYVGYLLTGERKVSYSSADRSLAFDVQKKEWSEELLSYAGIRLSQMSCPIAPCSIVGKILPDVAANLHLDPELKVVAGGHDQTCAALGSGLDHPERGECGMGTCEFMFMMLPRPQMTEYMIDNNFTCIPYVIEGTYLTSLEITTCGILKNWARDTILKGFLSEKKEGENDFTFLDRAVSGRTTDLLILPQLGSAGNPYLSMDAAGSITGLSIHTKAEEFYLAILEGIAFQQYLSYLRLKKLGITMNSFVATGGGAASDLTLQMRADLFNMKVGSLKNDESGTAGCMMMAATADGVYPDLKEAVRNVVHIDKIFYPDSQMLGYYLEKYKRFEEFFNRMHDWRNT